jgi:hypothetical protein
MNVSVIAWQFKAGGEKEREMIFCPFHHVYKCDLGPKMFLVFSPKTRRVRLSLVSIGEFSIYSKIFLAFCPDTLSVFSVHAKMHSETTSYKYNPSKIAVISARLKTFGAFSECV